MADPPPLTDVVVRLAGTDDIADLANVARACGQADEGVGGDPRYLAHLLRRGVMSLATVRGEPAGFAGSIDIDGVRMLTDLFVAPQVQRRGIGRQLLDPVWSGDGPKMTFASAHPAAQTLYRRRGLIPQWPLRYLVGRPDRLPQPTLTVEVVSAASAASAEREISGIDRVADYEYWTSRPRGWAGVVRNNAQTVGAFAVGGGDALQLDHAVAQPRDARLAVIAMLHCMAMVSPEVLVCVPEPHPAFAVLLDNGFRTVDTDMFMATPRASHDVTTQVLHPGLA